MVNKGDRIKVVRGVKVPKGTTGVAFWVGETKYGLRVGFKADGSGETLWTAMGNVERIDYSPAVAGAVAATAALSESAAYAALAARISALEAKLAALEAAAGLADADSPGADIWNALPVSAPFIPDNADPAEVAAFTN